MTFLIENIFHLVMLSIRIEHHKRELIDKQTFLFMIDGSVKTARPRREQTTISDLFPGIIKKPKETTVRHEQLCNFNEF